MNLYIRWEQDNDLGVINKLGLFEEYLEMGMYLTGTSLIAPLVPIPCDVYK